MTENIKEEDNLKEQFRRFIQQYKSKYILDVISYDAHSGYNAILTIKNSPKDINLNYIEGKSKVKIIGDKMIIKGFLNELQVIFSKI